MIGARTPSSATAAFRRAERGAPRSLSRASSSECPALRQQVFCTSPWVPAEWIRAHGLEARGIWFAPDRSPSASFAGDCAFARQASHVAEVESGSVFVFTTQCDQLRRQFDCLALSISHRVFLFNLPATWQTPVAKRIFLAELERLGRFLVANGGHEPTADALSASMEEHNRARKELLQSATSLPAQTAVEAVAGFYTEGIPTSPPRPDRSADWQSAVSPVGVPIALVGGPLYRADWGLFAAVQTAGARVVLNATEPGERNLWESTFVRSGVSSKDALLDALAEDYLAHCVDVFQRPNRRLYAWLGARLASRGARGIVLWVYSACDLWRGEAQTLRETFRLPVLQLEAGEAAGGWTRIRGRLEAFVESLQDLTGRCAP
jgi:benzoyl-CoA reductase/2-hydroxyglutaryl-CoA dehydratase subunit BcrC/BadD/HgdB